MSGIKIPVSAELNQQDISQQIKQVEAALNGLGRTAAEAGRAKFTPISKISLDDVQKMRREFEAMVRLAPGLKKALDSGGQGGRSFDKVDWGQVWKDKNQRGSHAATVLRYLSPNSVETTSPNGHGNGPAPYQSPGTQGGGWRRVAGGAAAGLAGGVASQIGGLGGGIASGALAGGLAGGPLGAGIGGLVGGLTSILSMVTEARDLAVSFDTLKRSLGDVGVSFDRLKGNSRGLADQYGLSDTEASSLMKRYAKTAGGKNTPDGLRDEVGVGVGFSRSFGLDPATGVDFFAQMKGLGVTKNANDNKRLALMIGESVAKAGDLPRMADVMSGLSRYIEGASRVSLSSPGTNEWMARMAGLENTGLTGMNPTNAGNIIGSIDSTIRQGGTSEASKNFMSGVLQREKGLDPIQAAIQLEGGAFGSGKSTFGPNSPMAAFYAKYGGGTKSSSTWQDGDSTVSTLQNELVKQYSGKPSNMLLDAFKNTFGTSYGQSAAWLASKPENNDRMVSRLNRLGIKPSGVSGSGISRLSQIESDGSLSESQKDAQTKIAASQNQEDTEGSKARETAEAGANAMRRLADEGLPILTSIQAAVLRIAGVDPAVEASEKAKIASAHLERKAAIEGKEGAEYNAAKKEHDQLVPFDLIASSRRLLGAKLSPAQQAAKERLDVARAAYQKAADEEKDRYAKEKWSGRTPATAVASAGATAPGAAPASEQDGGVPPGGYENDLPPGEEPSPGTSATNGLTPDLIRRAAESDRKAGLPPGTTAALMGVESSYRSGAVSGKGAGGLLQIMPKNVATYSKEAGRQLDPKNTDDAFYMYDKLMAERKAHYGGNVEKMLRSYHGGYDEDQWGPENRNYLPAIDKKKREMAANEAQRQQQTYQMPQTMQHAVAVDVTMRDPTGNRMDDVTINTSVGRPTVNGSKKTL